MKRSNFTVSLMMVLMLALVFSGCAKPHEADKSAAKTALEAARAAGADRYAAADFAEAKKLWDASEALVNEKKFEEAKQGYIDAKAAFEKAAGGVEAGKTAVTAEATAAVAALEEGWTKIEAASKKAPGKMGNKKLWETDSQGFLEGLKTAKEMVATDPAGAKAKADQLKRFVEVYSAFFTKPATKSPPAQKKDRAGEE